MDIDIFILINTIFFVFLGIMVYWLFLYIKTKNITKNITKKIAKNITKNIAKNITKKNITVIIFILYILYVIYFICIKKIISLEDYFKLIKFPLIYFIGTIIITFLALKKPDLDDNELYNELEIEVEIKKSDKFKLLYILDNSKKYEIEILKYHLQNNRNDKISLTISFIVSCSISIALFLLQNKSYENNFDKIMALVLFFIFFSYLYLYLIKNLFKITTNTEIYETIIEYEYLKNEGLIKEKEYRVKINENKYDLNIKQFEYDNQNLTYIVNASNNKYYVEINNKA